MGLTTDPSTPGLGHGEDKTPVPQNSVYLVLSDEELAKGFVRPLRHAYIHKKGCGALTTMGLKLCETYARDPKFYGSTYCTGCSMHKPVWEFVWSEDGQELGS